MVVTEAANHRITVEAADAFRAGVYDGFAASDEVLLDAGNDDLPGATSAPVASYRQISQDGNPGDVIVVTQGIDEETPGQVYHSTFSTYSGNYRDATLEATLGYDVRGLNCEDNIEPAEGDAELLCFAFNFGTNSLPPILLFDDINTTVVVKPELSVNNSPVSGDTRINEDGNCEVISTGFLDDGLYIGVYDFKGNFLEGAFGSVPDGCDEPGSIRYAPDNPDTGYTTCSGSNTIAKIDLIALRNNF